MYAGSITQSLHGCSICRSVMSFFRKDYVRSKHCVFQPLVEFTDKKCKRCGLYEKGVVLDDVFDEWELCPSDFTNPDGKCVHFKEKKLNVTFLCSECMSLGIDSNHGTSSPTGGKGMHLALVIAAFASVSIIFILGLIAAYKYWQKRRREQEQARFLKLIDEGDDIEDELGLGPLDGVI